MKKERGVLMLLSPEFRTKIKTESAMKNYTIIEYSRQLAKKKSLLEDFEDSDLSINKSSESKERTKGGFHFKI